MAAVRPSRSRTGRDETMSKRAYLLATALVLAGMCLVPGVRAQSIEEARRLLKEGKEIHLKARSQEDREKALQDYLQALRIFRRISDKTGICDALINLGGLYEELGQSHDAVRHLQEALETCENMTDPKRARDIFFALGASYSGLGELEKAKAYFLKLLPVCRELNDNSCEGGTCINLGRVYSALGDLDHAMEYLQKAVALFGASAERHGEGAALFSLARVYWNLRQYEKAEECCRRSLEIQRRLGDRRQEAAVLFDLGMLGMVRNQYDDAIETLQMALAIKKELKDRLGEVAVLKALAQVWTERGPYEMVEKSLQDAISICRDVNHRRGEGELLNELGNVLQRVGKVKPAAQYFHKALEIKRELGDRLGEGAVLNNLGIVHKDMRNYAEALAFYHKALQIYRELKERGREGGTLGNIGTLHWLQGNTEAALEYLEQSLAAFRELGNELGEARTLNNLGLAYAGLNQRAKALDSYKKALSLAKKIKDRAEQAAVLSNLGAFYSDRARHDKAAECLEECVAIARDLGLRKRELSAWNTLGRTYIAWRRYDAAEQGIRRALAIARELGDRSSEAQTLARLAEVYKRSGRFDAALAQYIKAESLHREIGDRAGEAAAVGNRGEIFSLRGEYEKALECHRRLRIAAKKFGHSESEAVSSNNSGVEYRACGRFKEALDAFANAHRVFKHVGRHEEEFLALENMAMVLSQMGQHAQALAIYRDLLRDRRARGLSVGNINDLIGNVYLDMGETERAEPFIREAYYRASLGRLYVMKSDYRTARFHYELLLQSAQETRHADNLFTAYNGLGFAYESMGRYADAANYYRKAVDLTEEVRSGLSQSQRQKFFDVKVGGFLRTSPFEGLARVLIRMDRGPDALMWSEYTKARVFAENISRRSPGSRAGVPIDVLGIDIELNDRTAALKKQMHEAFKGKDRLAMAALEPQIQELQQQRKAHMRLLRAEFPVFAATRYPEPMDLSQTALRAQEWAIAHDVTDSGVIIYLTRGKKLVKAKFMLIRRKELDELARRFREPLEIVPGRDTLLIKLKSFDFVSGKKLADLLLGELLEELPRGVPVIIVPDESLGVLPFEMLVLNRGGEVETDKGLPHVTGAQFFGDRNPTSYYQSITALTLARTFGNPGNAGKKVLVMADPIFDKNDPRLKRIADRKKTGLAASPHEVLMSIQSEMGLVFSRVALTGELGEALKNLDPGETDEYSGLQASKPILFAMPLERYGSMVFATHGYFGRDLPGIQEPVLVLTLVDQPKGRDGFLRMSEVMGLNLNAHIVALTACQTGLGRQITGEGVLGMGRAFQYAGARSVLMSLWSVAERSSVMLVEAFFKHLKGGRNKLEALHLAREEIRAKGYNHPFFWAPFILVGEVQ